MIATHGNGDFTHILDSSVFQNGQPLLTDKSSKHEKQSTEFVDD